MLYLLLPDLGMKWIDLPARMVLEGARKRKLDLGGLNWELSERRADDAIVGLALRSGLPCSIGVILDAGEVSVLDHPGDIRRAHAASAAAQEKLRVSTGAMMENIMPGWTADTARLDELVAESAESAIARAEQERAELLALPIKEEVLEHWRKIGGKAPIGS
ncbi:hypothetical protein AB0C38_23500 [Amycolatopsis sp. NPDC048633]|uniref:hypothetical protein n=1 Tax=Amycolatopsis sp. NPDC048633 TaxID=3157095 RepID=UPI003406AA44